MSSISHPIKISRSEARRFLLTHHFLYPPKSIPQTDILNQIFTRLGSIQFDSINVVGRNADLVLQSRVSGYQPEILDALLYQSRDLIDGWDKMASIYPAQDWPCFSRHRKRMRENPRINSAELHEISPNVMEAIRERGPLSSIDFKTGKKTDWWWGPTSVPRAALEGLYAKGEIGISHRVNTRRYFDLIENLIPPATLAKSDPNASLKENQDWHISRRVGSVGLAMPESGEHWMGINTARTASTRRSVLKRLIDSGDLLNVAVEELPGKEFFIRKADLPTLEGAATDVPSSESIAFIAPLDNLTWNRKMIQLIFDFHYVWEVYKPAPAREYGYYVLPVIFGDNFIARADMKYHRKSRTLNLLNWWWEEDAPDQDAMIPAINNGFRDFLHYLGATSMSVAEETFSRRKEAGVFKKIAKGLS